MHVQVKVTYHVLSCRLIMCRVIVSSQVTYHVQGCSQVTYHVQGCSQVTYHVVCVLY